MTMFSLYPKCINSQNYSSFYSIVCKRGCALVYEEEREGRSLCARVGGDVCVWVDVRACVLQLVNDLLKTANNSAYGRRSD